MHIAILDDYQGAALSAADWKSLGSRVNITVFHDTLAEVSAVAARLKSFEIVVAMRERTPFPEDLLSRLPALKLLVTTGKRNAAIDLAAAAKHGVLVCGTEMLPYPAAELTWGLILSLARQIPHEAQNMREGRWQDTVGTGLRGKALAVFGLGKLGAQVAKIGNAFGMEVIAWSQNLSAAQASAAGATLVTKEELFRRSDFLTLHLVLSERTRHSVGAVELGMMKPTAYLINTSRGPLVNMAELEAALRRGQIAGVALDVYDEEPLPSHHPLRRLENAVLTPHLGYVTVENYRKAYGEAVEDIRAFLEGKPIRRLTP